MASSSSSGDGPSTSGRGSGRPQYWDFELPPKPKALIYASENDRMLEKVLLEVYKFHIPGAKRHANKLLEKKIGLDEAITALANPNSKRHGPLHVAAWNHHLEMCKTLVKDYNCSPNATDADGSTPLLYAMIGGSNGSTPQAVVQYLIDSGADPVKANNRRITPLHCAAAKGYYKLAEDLLSIGDNVDPIDTNGEAPLHVAAGHGHAGIVTLLIQKHANLNRQTHELITPLVASLYGSSLECLQTLIQAGADIKTGSPVTPLSIAARNGLPECIKCLLAKGADPNECDIDGKLPIQIAASRGFRECVEILMCVTTPLEKYANWSTAHMLKREKIEFKLEASRAIEDGDAGYWEKEYANAMTCYTKAIRFGHNDAELFAKRSLCHLKNNNKERYLDDASTYMDKMKPDSSKPLYEEDAKQLVREFGKKWKKPKPGS